MANKKLFSLAPSKVAPKAETHNLAGGVAYSMDDEWALAQIAFTGTFSNTFYDKSEGENQLKEILERSQRVSPNYMAKLAVASREVGYMKAMPPALLLTLAQRNMPLARKVFDRIVDAPNMLKEVFTLVRSGRFGRRAFGYALKKAFESKLRNAKPSWLINLAIGTDPSIRDIFRMIRPSPRTKVEHALWGYLLDQPVPRWGGEAGQEDLPKIVLALDAYNKATTEAQQLAVVEDLKGVRQENLTGNIKGPKVWQAIIGTMRAQALRMNLNTLHRQGAFKDPEIVREVAARLADREEVRKSRQFPFQYLAAYNELAGDMPPEIRSGLHKAADAACGNIPVFGFPVAILVDVSGSMSTAPVTGFQSGRQSSKVMCIQAASLMAVALWRANPGSVLVPFDERIHEEALRFDPDDSLLSLTERLARYGGGGTNCSLSLNYVNTKLSAKPFGAAVMISDNESWMDRQSRHGGSSGIMVEFGRFIRNQQKLGKYPRPKLVCLDLSPGTTSQIPNTEHTASVGGFSDGVFALLGQFLTGDRERFVKSVHSVSLD